MNKKKSSRKSGKERVANLFKSKKAEDMLADFYWIIGFAVGLLFIFMLFWFSKESTSDNISVDFENKDAAFMLSSFLRAPTIYEGKSVSEIIIDDTYKNDFSRTETLFKNYFQGIDYYNNRPVDAHVLQISTKEIPIVFDISSLNTDLKNMMGKEITIIETNSIIPTIEGDTIKITFTLRYWDEERN